MHIYNEWLPPAIADQAAEAEPRRFHSLVLALLEVQNQGDVKSTLKFVSPIVSFINSLTELEAEDVNAVAKVALQLLTSCPDNLFAQIRWGSVLSKILREKHLRKQLQLTIPWRPLYELLTDVHLRRRHTYEGLALHQVHEQTVLTLVQRARCFFPPGAAQEIWAELSPAFKDLAHNDALEAAGLIALFLPTKSRQGGAESAEASPPPWKEWVAEWVRLWAAVPNCKYWDTQWGGLVARAIKHVAPADVDWEPHLPFLFTKFLNAIEVPVGKSQAQSPIDRSAPREMARMFAGQSLSEHIAASVVLLYGRYPSVRPRFEAFVDYLEQYYHPSNGGTWTNTLERLLRYLVMSFLKRLASEKKHANDPAESKPRPPPLTPELRQAFVTSMMRFVDRAQYSKSPLMVGQAASAAMGLAYAEPTVVLPLAIARFQQAVETVTATHQLESAVTTLALCTRPILLASPPFGSPGADPMELDEVPLGAAHVGQLAAGRAAIADALMHTLPGIDANDPPKTLATLQLYASVLSSVGTIGDPEDGGSGVLPLDWSDWVAEFLRRLLATLQNLEPSSAATSASGTFFMSGGSMFRPMLELLFGRLTLPLYKQALRKITEFVTSTVVPGAEAEVGFLCGAAMYARPELAAPALVPPLVDKVLRLLEGTETTGASGAESGWVKDQGNKKVPALSSALAGSVAYHLDVLCTLLMFGGPGLVAFKDSLVKLLAAAFDAPATKVVEAANRVLQSLLSSLVLYYSLDEYRSVPGLPDSGGIDRWLGTKGATRASPGMKPTWHVPNDDEVAFANELLTLHLTGALRDLRAVVANGAAGVEKDNLRVILLRLDGVVRGARACIPDFRSGEEQSGAEPLTVVGSAGASIGSPTMRDEAAAVLHDACKYMTEARSDDTVNMQQLLRVMDCFANFGSIEYSTWAHGRLSWASDANALTEPKFSVLPGGDDAQSRRRPHWLLVEKSFLHLTWRASQAHYRPFFPDRLAAPPPSVVTLTQDLLQMCLSRYNAVRTSARGPLERILKRYPTLVETCMPTLSGAMGGPDSNEETAMGACALYSTRVLMRRVTQDWPAMASFLTAMLASEKQESVRAQAAINEVFVVFALRFSRPSVSGGKGPKYSDVLEKIHSLLAEDKPSALHWRYTIMANAFLLLLTSHGAAAPLPGGGNASAKSPLEHFLRNLSSELPPLRPLSVVALLMLLQGGDEPALQLNPKALKLTSLKDAGSEMDVDEAEGGDVSGGSQAAEKQPATVSGGQVVAADVSSAQPAGGYGVLADMVASKGFAEKALRNLALDHNLSEGGSNSAGGLGAAAARMFQQGGASLIKAMGAVAAAKEWPHTKTKDAANRAVAAQAFNPTYAQLFERLAGVCSAEAIAALQTPLEEAVGAVHDRPSQCIAAEAMAGLLHGGGHAVRGAWDTWMKGLLQQALAGALPESQGEWAACLRYVATGDGPCGHQSPSLRSEVLACAAEPVSSTAASGQVAKRLILLGSVLAELTQAGEDDPALQFKAALLEELEGSMANPARQVRENVGRLLAMLFANLAQSPASGSPAGATWPTLQARAAALRQSLVEQAPAAVAKVQEISGGSESGEHDEAVRWMETVLFFVISAVKSGDAAGLAPTIVPLLHPIMAVQEVSDQDFALLAKQALAYLKYLPLPGSSLPGTAREIVAACGAANWHTRAAALVFLQAFAYRHSFLLEAEDSHRLREAVLQLLADSQLEVRELAAATLTGLLKGDDGSFAASVRERCTAAAKEAHAYSKNSKKKKAAGGGATSPFESVPARHGPILGLSACVLSSPYDVPKWLPKVLMTLAESVHEPSPINTTVTKTFGDFKRTHADTWTLHRTEFSEEELDVLADLTSSASYFV